MKRIASLLLTVALLATMLSVFAVPAFAETGTIDGTDLTWELTENDTKLIIDGDGVMPDYDIDTYENCPWHNAAETVTAVQINPGITTLGDFAFYKFEKLVSVAIPESVKSIGISAFESCSSLTSITIPESVESIGKCAFKRSGLTSVAIPGGVTSIATFTFGFCKALASVTISSGVKSIDISAFDSCSSLTSITIPSSVQSIGESAFSNCSSLTSLTIPYGVTSIGNGAFSHCTSLESISFPSSITNIGNTVFSNCSNLTSVTVKAKTPLTWNDILFLFPQRPKLTVYIPDGMSNVYKLTAGTWLQAFSQKKVKEAYVVDDQPGENGTITFDKDCFPTETYTEPNETVTVTVTPAEGYRLKADSLSVVAENGEAIALTQDETDPMKYTFTMPCSNVTVKAEFEEIPNESEPAPTASVFSEGSIWIIAAVAVVAIGGVVALVIVKKKKKPALASGTENKDEE